MNEWLKDRKNLPIVVALAVFVLLGAGGLIAFELGAFAPQQAAVAPSGPPVSIPGGPPTGAAVPGQPPPGAGGPGMRGGAPTELPRGRTVAPAAASAAVQKPVSTNPLVGPDPFKIPGGAQKLATTLAKTAIPRPALRDQIGPLNLFAIRPPALPVPPALPDASASNPAANYRLSGVITGSDGINAIVEVGGQSQSVKPGDSLPDGTQVQNIQTNSITLRTATGAVFNLPLSAGTPDQGQNNFNGPPGFNPGFNQGGFNGGYPGRPQYVPNGQG